MSRSRDQRELMVTMLIAGRLANGVTAMGMNKFNQEIIASAFDLADRIITEGDRREEEAELNRVETDGVLGPVSKCSACGEDHEQVQALRDRKSRHFLCPTNKKRVEVAEG